MKSLYNATGKTTGIIPPLSHRIAEGRPVLTRAQIMALTERLITMSTMEVLWVQVTHKARIITRVANNEILTSDDGDQLRITMNFGDNLNPMQGWVNTNQLDDSVLRAVIQQFETVARERVQLVDSPAIDDPQFQDTVVPTELWHDSTIRAMATVRGTVVPELIERVERNGLRAAGFVGLMAKSEAFVKKDNGISFYHEETDSEVTVTARSVKDKSSGWGGQAARDWDRIDYKAVADHAVKIAKMSANPVALEPGRRTAILSSAAVTQLLSFLKGQFGGIATTQGNTGFSKKPTGTKHGMRVFDSRISMRSDPNDPDGGFRPWWLWGYAAPAITYIENGKLMALSWDINHALSKHRQYSEEPYSMRVSGGETSIEQMIAQCDEGVYVNRLSGMSDVDERTGLVTGVTRDGCFYVKNGKIEKSVKNFRILESPHFVFNKLLALGPTTRAAIGYAPAGQAGIWGDDGSWPFRRPMIVPPMMVGDFNFASLADAV
jgi:predicted Zn-dependent protease